MKPFKRCDFERMWVTGVKVVEIAAELSCAVSTVSKHARRLGLTPRGTYDNRRGKHTLRDYTPVHAEFSAMVAQGAKVRELATHFRISSKTVCRLKRELFAAAVSTST